MRRKHSFLLTIFPTEEEQPALHGRLQFISNGSSYTFNNLEELQRLIEDGISGQQPADQATQIREEKTLYVPEISPSHYSEEV